MSAHWYKQLSEQLQTGVDIIATTLYKMATNLQHSGDNSLVDTKKTE